MARGGELPAMGVLIAIGRFIFTALSRALPFLVSMPGMIIAAFVGFALVIASVASDVWNSGTLIINLLVAAKNAVQEAMDWLNGMEYYGVFHHLFAFDTLGSVFSSFVTVAISLAVLTVFEFFFQAVVIAVPFLICKSVSKILSQVTLGQVKT